MQAFESGQLASSEASLGEYVKALVAVDRLDTSSLIRTLQVRRRLQFVSNAVVSLGCFVTTQASGYFTVCLRMPTRITYARILGT